MKKLTIATLLALAAGLLSACTGTGTPSHSEGTPLHAAVKAHDTAKVRRLLDKGSDPNLKGNSYYTPLGYAMLHGKGEMDIVQTLLNGGAKATGEDVMTAAGLGYPQYLRAMLDAGGQVPRCGKDSAKTPVWNKLGEHLSSEKTDRLDVAACARLLEERGISPHDPAYARYPLHYAAQWGNEVPLADYLLHRGFRVNSRDEDGATPLMKADDNAAMTRLLLEHGANVNAQAKDGSTALMNKNLEPEVAHVLLEAGANPNLRNKKGENALLFQIRHPRPTGGWVDDGDGVMISWSGVEQPIELLRLLIEAGANVNMPDKQGIRPLQDENSQCDEKLRRLLQQAGAR